MPRGDGTGPNGLMREGSGFRNGHRAGFCAGFNTPRYLNHSGRGICGFGRGDSLSVSQMSEREYLDAQAEFLSRKLEAVNKRRNEVKDAPTES